MWKPKALILLSVVGTSLVVFLSYFKVPRLNLAQQNYPSAKPIVNAASPQNFPLKKILQSVATEQSTSLHATSKSFSDHTFAPVNFDINGTDVIVFLHIQKTGGSTFGRHLVKDMQLAKKCVNIGRKRHHCFRPNSHKETWLFSRFTTGIFLSSMLNLYLSRHYSG